MKRKVLSLFMTLILSLSLCMVTALPAMAEPTGYSLWSDDFDDNIADQTWTAINDYGTDASATVQNNQYELSVAKINETTDGAVISYVGTYSAEDAVMEATVNKITGDNDKFLAYLLMRTDVSNLNAYTLGISSGDASQNNKPHLWLGKLTGGVYSTLSGGSKELTTWDAGFASCHLKFEVSGTTLRGKAWIGDTEPTEWDVQVTDSSYSGGGPAGIMLATYSELTTDWTPANVAFDNISLSTSTAVEMTANSPAQIGISVSPTSVNFGSLTSGVASTGHTITVTNTGNVAEVFSTSLTNVSSPDVYTIGLKLSDSLVNAWSASNVAVSGTSQPQLVLTIPSGTAPGTYTATLVFWAEAAE